MGDAKRTSGQKPKQQKTPSWLYPMIGGLLAVVLVTVIILNRSEETTQTPSKTDEHAAHQHGDESQDESTGKDDQSNSDNSQPVEPNVSPKWRLLKTPALTSEPVQLSFQFAGYKDKQTVTDYETYHDKKMHLIVVSTDLQDFLHVHPDLQADGGFNAVLDLKRSTTYKIYADAKSASKGLINETAGLYVRDPQDLPANYDPKTTKLTVPPDVPAKLAVDADRLQTVEGLNIRLTTDNLKVGKPASLTFTFQDAESGADVTNLETYLGAVGHVIMISENLGEYVHTHPIDEKQRGPIAEFQAQFKKPGKYKLWGEFRHKGKQVLVPYVIEVKA